MNLHTLHEVVVLLLLLLYNPAKPEEKGFWGERAKTWTMDMDHDSVAKGGVERKDVYLLVCVLFVLICEDVIQPGG